MAVPSMRIFITRPDGNCEIIECAHGDIQILNHEGKELFNIRPAGDDGIEVRAATYCKNKKGNVLDRELNVTPECRSGITIRRPEYK